MACDPQLDGICVSDNEVPYDKNRKELQDFLPDHHPSDSEIEYGESEVRSLFHNSGISNYLFPRPGDRVGCSNLVVT
jgi:hypothetical protein